MGHRMRWLKQSHGQYVLTGETTVQRAKDLGNSSGSLVRMLSPALASHLVQTDQSFAAATFVAA
jgi:hypothetical protein